MKEIADFQFVQRVSCQVGSLYFYDPIGRR
jgi:hypothetical protein